MMKRKMKKHLTKILAVLFLTTGTALNAQETDMQTTQPAKPERLGVYVLADDLNRSEAFYSTLFGASPAVRTEVFAGYDVAGGLFAVVSRATFAPDAKLGGNAIPYIKVDDIEAAYQHVRTIAPDALKAPGVISEGPLSLFKFTDPDGNIIEYFSLNAPIDGL
ncbi:VOC family protein [Roseibium sp.]|uniref:VOC family protein n=2 Tax=Roseibium sp. TaxID=1936156 RepID=UPI003D0A85D9